MEFLSSLMFLKGLFYSFFCFLVIAACILVPSIIRPTVIEYPWRFPDSPSHRERDRQLTVVLAGSFNPPHNGHLAMIEYLSKRSVICVQNLYMWKEKESEYSDSISFLSDGLGLSYPGTVR